MIQLVILFIFVVFIILIILLYKKYIKIKNLVDEEKNLKYDKIKNKIGSNNSIIKKIKQETENIIMKKGNNLAELINKSDQNSELNQLNHNDIISNDLNSINNIFSYDNGLFIGGSDGRMVIGDNNIKLNVENPVQVRVCNSDNSHCSNIITNKMVNEEWPINTGNNGSDSITVSTGSDDSDGGIGTGGGSSAGGDALIYSPDHPDHNGKKYFIFNNTTNMLSVTPNMTISSIGLFSTVPNFTPIVTDNMKVSNNFNNYYASISGSGVTDSDIIDFSEMTKMTNQITTTDTEFILISSDNFDYRINIVDGIVKSIVDFYVDS